MINRPKNWDSVQEFGDRQKKLLPAGAYVCRIKKAIVQTTAYGNQLCCLFDIVHGEYAGFFDEDFKANQREDKKWRGVLRVWLPKDDGTEKDEWTKSILKGFTTSVERSNPGYQFDFNEASLAGKEVGIIFRNEEWEYNGKSGWSARPFRATSVDSVADGTFYMPEDKPLKRSVKPIESIPGYDNFKRIDEADGELPF